MLASHLQASPQKQRQSHKRCRTHPLASRMDFTQLQPHQSKEVVVICQNVRGICRPIRTHPQKTPEKHGGPEKPK